MSHYATVQEKVLHCWVLVSLGARLEFPVPGYHCTFKVLFYLGAFFKGAADV